MFPTQRRSPRPENVSSWLLSAMQPLHGEHFTHASMSVYRLTEELAQTSQQQGLIGLPNLACVFALDHLVTLSPSSPTALPGETPIATVLGVPIDSLTIAYDFAVLATRMIARGWANPTAPVSLACPQPEDRPTRTTLGQLERIQEPFSRLAHLRLKARMEITRTYLAASTFAGNRQHLATHLSISKSTVRSHLDTFRKCLGPTIEPHDLVALNRALPVARALWRAELARNGQRAAEKQYTPAPPPARRRAEDVLTWQRTEGSAL